MLFLKKQLTGKFYLILAVGLFIIYIFSSPGNTPYNYFTRLSESFIQGKYWLSENPPWLSELIPVEAEKYYVVYPPLPALIAVPFVYLFGAGFPQQILAHILGALTIIVIYKTSLFISKTVSVSIWISLLAGVGSIIWFLSSVGSSWYLGQVSACLFLSLSLYESLNKKRPFLLGVFIGAAYLARINTIISLPFLYFIMQGKFKISVKDIFYISLGILPFFLFNFYYNFIRYGVIWDKSYFLLPQILNEENAWWFAKGVMHPSYILNNIKTAFWSFPIIKNHFPFITPSWAGLSIWITTPAFIYAIFAPLKSFTVKNAWMAIAVMFLFVAMHGGTGFAQFGYRFAVDFYPFIFFLIAKGLSEKKLKWHHITLLVISIIINAWGVIWINKFGWVSY